MKRRTIFANVYSILRGWRYAIVTLVRYQRRRFMARHNYYEYKFRRMFGHSPNYTNPLTFTEKLAWMRLYDHNPLYKQLVDKIAVRDYVRERVGDDVLIPLYGVWERAGDIPFDSLPDSFVLKCNHESGFVILCRDRAQLDRDYARIQLATRLRMNHYHRFLEWPYRDVPRRIIAEELLLDEQGMEPIDYKFHCFNGVPGFAFVVKNRHHQPIYSNYSPNWEILPFTYSASYDPVDNIPRPAQLERMLEIAGALSRGLHYCRVDLYAVKGRVYFGEITIIPGAGLFRLIPVEHNRYWGDAMTLPMSDAVIKEPE